MIFGPQNGWRLPEILPELCFASQPSWLSSLPGERTGTVWFELYEQQFRSFGMVSSMHCRAASTSQTASGCCLSHDILQVFSVNKQLHAIAAIMIQHDSTMLLLKKLTIKNDKNLLMMHFVSAWKFSRKSPASSTYDGRLPAATVSPFASCRFETCCAGRICIYIRPIRPGLLPGFSRTSGFQNVPKCSKYSQISTSTSGLKAISCLFDRSPWPAVLELLVVRWPSTRSANVKNI